MEDTVYSVIVDQELKDALLDGASALKYRAERLACYTLDEEESAMLNQFKENARILEDAARK